MARRRSRSAAQRALRLPGSGGDAGPPERYQHGDVIRAEPGEDAGVFYRRVATQSALDRYLTRGQILEVHGNAGIFDGTGSKPSLFLCYSLPYRASSG